MCGAVFLAHAFFNPPNSATGIWEELRERLQERRGQSVLPTPSGPVRLEIARERGGNSASRPGKGTGKSGGRSRGKGNGGEEWCGQCSKHPPPQRLPYQAQAVTAPHSTNTADTITADPDERPVEEHAELATGRPDGNVSTDVRAPEPADMTADEAVDERLRDNCLSFICVGGADHSDYGICHNVM